MAERRRDRFTWRNLTAPPDGHEGPWPVQPDHLSKSMVVAAIILFTVALAAALNIVLSDFGAHPGLRLIVSMAVTAFGIAVARWYLKRHR